MMIEIYSDVVCPWCYIGEQRLARALAQRPNLTVERHWRPFQLQPNMPAEGIPWAEVINTKFGGPERARAAFAQVAKAGADENLTFNFDHITHAANTVDAHRLILYAARHEREWEMAEALFAAYFTDGANLNDHNQLVAIASAVGLPADEVAAYLATDEDAADVLASQDDANDLGITGVPFFIFDGRFAVSGAQPLEIFLRALDLAQTPAVEA